MTSSSKTKTSKPRSGASKRKSTTTASKGGSTTTAPKTTALKGPRIMFDKIRAYLNRGKDLAAALEQNAQLSEALSTSMDQTIRAARAHAITKEDLVEREHSVTTYKEAVDALIRAAHAHSIAERDLVERSRSLTTYKEALDALILENEELEAENDRLRAKIDRLSGEVRYPREEYPR